MHCILHRYIYFIYEYFKYAYNSPCTQLQTVSKNQFLEVKYTKIRRANLEKILKQHTVLRKLKKIYTSILFWDINWK